MYLRIFILTLMSYSLSANITCDFVDIDLYAPGNVKTHSCDCRVCYDSDTQIRTSPSINDHITLGNHWNKFKFVNDDQNLDLNKVLLSANCPSNNNHGQLDASDIVTTTALLRALIFQDQLCRSVS